MTTAKQIDVLLAQVARAYHALPRTNDLPRRFREALGYAGVPGSYVPHGTAPRPLAESLKTK